MIIRQFLESLTPEEVASEVFLKPEQITDHDVFTIAIAKLPDGRVTIQTAAMNKQSNPEFMLAAAARMIQLTAKESGLGLEGTEEALMRMIPCFQERDPDNDVLNEDD